MDESQSPLFEDAESTTRRTALNVVHAAARSIASFRPSYFEGYRSMRALTYTSSIPMIAELMAAQRFEEFECVFGHGGILSREAAKILAFQNVVRDKLAGAIVGVKGIGDEAREAIFRRVADGGMRFYVVKDAIAHAKIYLLEGDVGKRVIVGSANLSERAFSGRQAEGCWNLSGNRILVGVSAMEFIRTRADIPDWLLDDTASSSGQIALDRKLTEDFLRRRIRAPRRWFWRRG